MSHIVHSSGDLKRHVHKNVTKNCGRPGPGGSKISDTCGQGGGSKIGQILRTSFIYGP